MAARAFVRPCPSRAGQFFEPFRKRLRVACHANRLQPRRAAGDDGNHAGRHVQTGCDQPFERCVGSSFFRDRTDMGAKMAATVGADRYGADNILGGARSQPDEQVHAIFMRPEERVVTATAQS